MGTVATSARGSSRRGATFSIGAAATTPAKHDMMQFTPWLESLHSVAKGSPSGTVPDTAADMEKLVAEKNKFAPGAMIKNIARRTPRNRFTLAANITTRCVSLGPSPSPREISLGPLGNSI